MDTEGVTRCVHIEGRLGVDTVRRNQVCLYLALEPPTSRSVRNKFLLFKPTHGVFFFSFFCHDNLSKLIQNLLTNNACYLLTPFSMNTLVSLQLRKVLLFLLFFSLCSFCGSYYNELDLSFLPRNFWTC